MGDTVVFGVSTVFGFTGIWLAFDGQFTSAILLLAAGIFGCLWIVWKYDSEQNRDR